MGILNDRRNTLSKSLLLLQLEALNEESVSFVGLNGEILLVLEKVLELDHVFIEEHASDTASKNASKSFGNNWEDRVADEFSPLIRTSKLIEEISVYVGEWQRRIHRLGWNLRLRLLLVVLSGYSTARGVSHSTTVASTVSSAATSLILVSAAVLVLLLSSVVVVILTALGERPRLVRCGHGL